MLTLGVALWWRSRPRPVQPTAAAPVAIATPKTPLAPTSTEPVFIPPPVIAFTLPPGVMPGSAKPSAAAVAHRDKEPPADVAIQDGKTIDFSSGRPVVNEDEKQKASIDKALKEMDEATQGVTFTPKESATPAPAEAPVLKP